MEHTQFNLDFGRRVKLTRKAVGFKAEKTAEAAGISTQFLSDVERGKKGMGGYNVARLAQALGVSTDYLLYGRSGTGEEWDLAAERISAVPPALREMAAEVLTATLAMLRENVPQ